MATTPSWDCLSRYIERVVLWVPMTGLEIPEPPGGVRSRRGVLWCSEAPQECTLTRRQVLKGMSSMLQGRLYSFNWAGTEYLLAHKSAVSYQYTGPLRFLQTASKGYRKLACTIIVK